MKVNTEKQLSFLSHDQINKINTNTAKEWAIVDIETSDAYLKQGRIIEFAVIIIKDFKIKKKYSTLVNPMTDISSFISNLTGITNQELEKAPTFDQVCLEIYELLENRLFIAHNVNFDYNFLKSEFKSVGYNLKEDRMCSVRLSRYFFPQFRRHNLDTIKNRYGLTIVNRHRAYDDAYAVYQFMTKVRSKISDLDFCEAVAKITKKEVS